MEANVPFHNFAKEVIISTIHKHMPFSRIEANDCRRIQVSVANDTDWELSCICEFNWDIDFELAKSWRNRRTICAEFVLSQIMHCKRDKDRDSVTRSREEAYETITSSEQYQSQIRAMAVQVGQIDVKYSHLFRRAGVRIPASVRHRMSIAYATRWKHGMCIGRWSDQLRREIGIQGTFSTELRG